MNSLIVVPTRLWEYCIAAIIIILAPGPSVLFVIARAIAWGRATAVATVAGNVMGAFSLSVVVAVGLGPILQRSDLAFTSVQVLGGCYLVYLGITAIKHSQIHASDMTNQGDVRPSKWKSMREGFWVGALNPKGIVFFAAILAVCRSWGWKDHFAVDSDGCNLRSSRILLRWWLGNSGRND